MENGANKRFKKIDGTPHILKMNRTNLEPLHQSVIPVLSSNIWAVHSSQNWVCNPVRLTGEDPFPNPTEDQSACPFRLFMESFIKETNWKPENLGYGLVDRLGLYKWKAMSREAKMPFYARARELDQAHLDACKKEAEEIIKVDDEATSSMKSVEPNNLEPEVKCTSSEMIQNQI